MKITACFSILFIFLGINVDSQIIDSIVKFSDLSFKSDFEKHSFKDYAAAGKKSDIINLFLTNYKKEKTDNSTKTHKEIEDCVNTLIKETEGMTEPKKVKAIYKYVHNRFFKVYKLNNSFSDIFDTGEYNCVSGSAMYAIIFEKMNIPYQIVEAPQHVFLFAYPNTHKIAIETTIPVNGYFIFNDNYIEKFIKYMYETKLISKEEYESNSVNDLFNKYYFATKGVSIIELAGIQYSNFALYHREDKDYESSLEEIKKSYFILPNQRNMYIMENELSYLVSNKNYKNEQDVKNLAILCRFNNANKKELSNEKIKYEFSRITQEQLISNSNFSMYEKSFNTLNSAISDSTLKNDIAFYYHYELARVGYNNFKDYDYELPHLKAAYILKPKHVDLQSMIKSYLGKLIQKSEAPAKILKQIEDYSTIFDFLNVDNQYNSLKSDCILELAYESFTLKDIIKGENYINTFENIMSENETLKATEHYVEKAYSSAATYYFKKGNNARAKNYLKSGIKYAPDNFGLKIRLNQIH